MATPIATAQPAATDHRRRLMAGFAAALEEKGYAATTIADVVRHARVSKRTFYEHFADKESCLLDFYDATNDAMLRLIAREATADIAWPQRVRRATVAYLSVLAARPATTRAFLIEVQAAGPRALAARRAMHVRFAELLRGLVDAARAEHPELPRLSREMARAVVGAINELMIDAVEQDEIHRLPDLAPTAADLLLAVLRAPAPSSAR